MGDKVNENQRKKGTGLDFYDTPEEKLQEIINEQTKGGNIDNDDLMRLIVSGEEKKEKPKAEKTFKVHGVEMELEDETVKGARIPLFDGAVLDLTDVTLDVSEGNGGEKIAEDSGSMAAKIILAPANMKILQQFSVTDILLREDGTKEPGKPSVEGKTAGDIAFPFENGDMFMAKQGSFDDHLFKSEGDGRLIRNSDSSKKKQKTEKKDIIIDAGGLMMGNSVAIADAADAIRTAMAMEEKEAKEKADSIDKAEKNPKEIDDSKGKKPPGGDGDGGQKDVENPEKEIKKENEEEEKPLIDNLSDEDKGKVRDLAESLGGKGSDTAKNAFSKAAEKVTVGKLSTDPKATIAQFKKTLKAEFKSGLTKEVEEAPKDELMDAVSEEVWGSVEGLKEKLDLALQILGYAGIYIAAAKQFGIKTAPIAAAVNNCISAIAGFSDDLKNSLETVIPKGDKEEEPEDTEEEKEQVEGEKVSFAVTVFPGFNLEFFLEPTYKLTFSGHLKLDKVGAGQNINLAVGVNATGQMGLKIEVSENYRNDLTALIAEVAGEARIVGIMEGEKFAVINLNNVNFGKMTKDGPELTEPAFEKADYNIGGEVQDTPEGFTQGKSEVFEWEKELRHGSLEAVLSSANLEGNAAKEGKLFSLSGWKVSQLSLGAAYLYKKKTDLMKLSFVDHTIERAEELKELSDEDLIKPEALDGKMESLQKLFESASEGDKDLAAGLKDGEDSITEKALRLFEQLKKGYKAVFVKLEADGREIVAEIDSFLSSSETKNVFTALEKGVAKKSGDKSLEDMRDKAMRDKKDLEERKAEINSRFKESNDVIAAVESQMSILRERPKYLDEYQRIPTVASTIEKTRESLRSVQSVRDKIALLHERLSDAAESRRQMADAMRQ